jgi:hypothetical protein
MNPPMSGRPSTLIIACGALAREITQVIATHGWSHMTVTCLPAHLHNRPDRIPEAVRGKIRATKDRYDRQLVLYGDCGTGGLLDAVLEEEGVERIPGPHCYEFFAGAANFAALAEEEPGTFFLTDFLVRHFDRLIIEGLGLDRYPQLLPDYFGHYRKLVHLAQVEDTALDAAAKRAALRLGLTHQRRFTGLGGLAAFLRPDPAGDIADGRTDRRLLA